jgi:hypothetical protein
MNEALNELKKDINSAMWHASTLIKTDPDLAERVLVCLLQANLETNTTRPEIIPLGSIPPVVKKARKPQPKKVVAIVAANIEGTKGYLSDGSEIEGKGNG